MTERRHVPGDSNLSRPKTNWDMAKEKETQINTEIQKRKENNTEQKTRDKKKIERKGCASLIIAAFASPVMRVSSICQTRISAYTTMSYRALNSCFLHSASMPPTCQMLHSLFVFQSENPQPEFDRCVALFHVGFQPFSKFSTDFSRMKEKTKIPPKKHDVSNCHSLVVSCVVSLR